MPIKPFLQLVADDLFERSNGDFSNVSMIFPNRRAILYFNRYLSLLSEKPMWAPKYFTITELIQQMSKLHKAEDLYLLFELHKIYCKINKTDESFDNFYFWGEMILSDFDDIDKYLIDASLLFRNLAALKNINERFAFLDDEQIEAIRMFWSHFKPGHYSKLQKLFVDIWSVLKQVYDGLKVKLISEQTGYEGMLYRQVAENIKAGKAGEITWDKIVFAGFNALNECEKEVFRYSKASGKALFYWDYDTDYTRNDIHKAGLFIRNNLQEFPSALHEQHFSNLSSPKGIEIFSIPSNVGQAKSMGQILEQIPENKFENTAILLPDENLLMPVLHSIPAKISQVNVTMGYPVRHSLIAGLLNIYFDLSAAGKTDTKGNTLYYYKHVIELFKHPYILQQFPNLADEISQTVTRNNIFWLSDKYFPENEFLNLFFIPVNNETDIAGILMNIIAGIDKLYGKSTGIINKDIEKEILRTVYRAIKRLADIFKQNHIVLEKRTFQKILTKVLNSLKVPFEGEPLAGMQVMGFLESRTLDFENIIILSCNEGHIPKTNLPPSYIPYNLRKGFGMPTIEHRDSIYAYYFYRAIQRASNVRLIYNTKGDSMGNAEISRFVTQLKYESKQKLLFKTQTFQIPAVEEKEIAITKTPGILSLLSKYTRSSGHRDYLSPTALNAYLDCSLRFYFRYIAGLKEPEEPAEEIDPPMLGRLLHKAIQLIYEPFINRNIQSDAINELLKDTKLIETAIFNALGSEYLKGDKPADISALHGRNLIVFRILNRYIAQILKTDKGYAPFKIIGMETNVKGVFHVDIGNKAFEVSLGGNIDRIDQTEEGIRIVDYKTGPVEDSFKDYIELFGRETEKLKKEILQIFLYALLYAKDNQNKVPIIPALYKVREIFDDNFDYHIYFEKKPVTDILSIKEQLIKQLENTLAEMFNPGIPFSKTKIKAKCEYCPYAGICHRN
jgi:CRISPR/Cas system-associated exonuclease Cas4 (RecB family)